jgi:hypothetical protein
VRSFEAGASVALREIRDGRVWAARAVTVVTDTDAGQVFVLPAGAPWFDATRHNRLLHVPEDDWDLTEMAWPDAWGGLVSFAWPDVPYGVLRLFNSDGSPERWYVNLQEPLRRTAIGFDTADRLLDVLVEDDGTWRWKDEEHLEEAVRRGLVTAEQASELRRDGERAIDRIRRREPPLDRDWDSWLPDPSWPAPELPPGWDRV